jgi:hypothetical protein
MVPDRQAHLSERSAIGPQLVGDDNEGRASGLLQQLAHEPKGSALVAPGLNENVEDLTVLINGSQTECWMIGGGKWQYR